MHPVCTYQLQMKSIKATQDQLIVLCFESITEPTSIFNRFCLALLQVICTHKISNDFILEFLVFIICLLKVNFQPTRCYKTSLLLLII